MLKISDLSADELEGVMGMRKADAIEKRKQKRLERKHRAAEKVAEYYIEHYNGHPAIIPEIEQDISFLGNGSNVWLTRINLDKDKLADAIFERRRFVKMILPKEGTYCMDSFLGGEAEFKKDVLRDAEINKRENQPTAKFDLFDFYNPDSPFKNKMKKEKLSVDKPTNMAYLPTEDEYAVITKRIDTYLYNKQKLIDDFMLKYRGEKKTPFLKKIGEPTEK